MHNLEKLKYNVSLKNSFIYSLCTDQDEQQIMSSECAFTYSSTGLELDNWQVCPWHVLNSLFEIIKTLDRKLDFVF